jgi:hypothetical protein
MYSNPAIRRPIVQGAGHIELQNGERCAIYEDNDGKLYATAYLIPIAQYVKDSNCTKFMIIETEMIYSINKL